MAKKTKAVNPATTRVDVEYVAKKNFRFQGRPFAIGQEFPWRTLSCSERRVRLLEDGGYILSAQTWADRGHEIEELKTLPDPVEKEAAEAMGDPEEFGMTAEEAAELEAAAALSDQAEADGEPASAPEPAKRDKDATGGKDQDNK